MQHMYLLIFCVGFPNQSATNPAPNQSAPSGYGAPQQAAAIPQQVTAHDQSATAQGSPQNVAQSGVAQGTTRAPNSYNLAGQPQQTYPNQEQYRMVSVINMSSV